MKLAIMQPYFFPYIGYFQLINAVDKYIIYDNLNFIKDGWVNRNNIYVKNYGKKIITLPIQKKSSFSKISDIKICDNKKLISNIGKTIELQYRKAPHFETIYPLLKEILNYETNNLSVFNTNLITSISTFLNIDTCIESDSGKYIDIEYNIEHAKYKKMSQYSALENKIVRIFKICEREKANVFINAIGGTGLYSKTLFKDHGIDLFFLKTNKICYKQFNNVFVPKLSIIDVLMHNGKIETQKLLNQFTLI